MGRVFFIADTHFEHRNILTLSNRPWNTVEEMNKDLIERWNAIVQDDDKVYHLGDVSLNKRGLDLVENLKGKKVLIRGNHDWEKIQHYLRFFKDVRGTYEFDQFVLSHVPVHPSQKVRFLGNIHGHNHEREVLMEDKPDPWYLSVSVEQPFMNYQPILFTELVKIFEKRAKG